MTNSYYRLVPKMNAWKAKLEGALSFDIQICEKTVCTFFNPISVLSPII